MWFCTSFDFISIILLTMVKKKNLHGYKNALLHIPCLKKIIGNLYFYVENKDHKYSNSLLLL